MPKGTRIPNDANPRPLDADAGVFRVAEEEREAAGGARDDTLGEDIVIADDAPAADIPGDNALAEEDSAAEDVIDDEAAVDDEEEPEEDFSREAIVALGSKWCTACAGSGCTRCLAVCPAGALTLTDEGPRIDEEACTRCGLCAGICDAFAWERITLEDLLERAKRETAEEGVVCFTCADHLFPGLAPRSNVVALPCLGAVPPEFWGAALAEGVEVGIFRDPAYCDDCPVAGARGMMLFEHALETAQAWTGRTAQTLDEIPERETLLAALSSIDEGDRRALLSKFASEGKDIAAGKHRKRNAATVDGFHEQQERLRAEGRIQGAFAPVLGPSSMNKHPWPRQELMVRAACALPERADLVARYCSTTDAALCAKSHDCIEACPTGARSIDEAAGLPVCDPRLCTACGICVTACPAGACDYREITASAYGQPAEE